MHDQSLRNVAERHGIVLLVQFGSSITGATHARSDTDLAVLLADPDVSFVRLAELDDDLHALMPDRPVDVAVINRADPLFLKKILETGRLLYGPERRFQELKLYAFRRYQDHRKYLRLERDYVRRALGAPVAS